MSLGTNKIVLVGANLTTSNAGAYFQNANLTVNTAGANANILIPAGMYYANTPSNCAVYANLNTGSNLIVVAANTVGFLWSDGVNVYANTTTNGTLAMITVNSGSAANTTFSS